MNKKTKDELLQINEKMIEIATKIRRLHENDSTSAAARRLSGHIQGWMQDVMDDMVYLSDSFNEEEIIPDERCVRKFL